MYPPHIHLYHNRNRLAHVNCYYFYGLIFHVFCFEESLLMPDLAVDLKALSS